MGQGGLHASVTSWISRQSIALLGYHPPHEFSRRAAPPRLARRLPRLRDVPHDGRGAAPGRGRLARAGERALGLPGFPPDACPLGRVLPPRPHSAVVFVHGRRGRAVLDGQSPGEGSGEGADDAARVLASLHPGGAGDLPPLHRPGLHAVHVRRHADADRAGIRLPVPAGVPPLARRVDRAGPATHGILGGVRRCIRCPGPGSTGPPPA